jgi:ADP-ribosylglycohydrolase
MSTTIPTQIEKCKGAMLATAIGDALGWPNEPRSKNRIKKPKVNDFFVEWTRSCKEPRWHDEKILLGEYSDDTQMTLSVARSIIAGDWEKVFAEKELPFWLGYERGGGGALLKAARSLKEKNVLLWQSSYAKDYFNAGGNGAAMRILPHVIAAANKPDAKSLILDIIKDTLITHGHPRAFLGATCYAFALDYLLRKNTILEYGELVTAVIDGQRIWSDFPDPDVFGRWIEKARQYAAFNYEQEWERVRSSMLRQLDFIKSSLKKGLILDDTKVLTELDCFSSANGAGDVATLTAIYLASRYATNPTLGIKIPAFSLGADTDTIASITGGLLGMLCGTNWIPAEWRAVQDYDCLVQMSELLLSDHKKMAAKVEVANVLAQENEWTPTAIGKMRFLDSREYPNGKYGVVSVARWKTALGQTLYFKEFRPFTTALPAYPQSTFGMKQLVLEQIKTDSSQSGITTTSASYSPEAVQNHQSQFILDPKRIETIMKHPNYKEKITLGKLLKILLAILEETSSINEISKKFGIEEDLIIMLKTYVK